MELVYSNQKSGFEPGKSYRNPQYFERPELGVTRITVIGDWPEVVAAHQMFGIDVDVIEVPKDTNVGGTGPDPLVVDAMRRDLDSVDVIVDSLPSGEFSRPAEGETAQRLFEALTNVSVSIQDVVTERDSLLAEREELLGQIQELKDLLAKQPGDTADVESLKAKLDSAGVSYRSNASKESLEKLMADHSKA